MFKRTYCIFFITTFFLLLITSFFLCSNVFAKPDNIPVIISFGESPSQSDSLKLVWDSKGSDTIEVMDNTNQKLYKFGGATEYTFQGLVNGKSYEVMIRACDRIDGLYDCTNWSPVSSATAKELNNNSNNNNNNTNYTASSFSLSPTSFTYDGAAKRPKVTVKNTSGTVLLKEGTDYKVEYKNNINVGTGTCLVTGLGNYEFTKTLTFNIINNGFKSATLSSSNYTYNGKTKTPSVTVMNNKNSKLVKGRDYSVIYQSGRVKIGTYRVRVIGKGNYKFDKSLYFKINPAATKISKISNGTNYLTIKYNKVSGGVNYQIGYKKTTEKNYKYKYTNSNNYKITKLNVYKNYNIIIRPYKKIGNVTYYGNWVSRVAKTKYRKPKILVVDSKGMGNTEIGEQFRKLNCSVKKVYSIKDVDVSKYDALVVPGGGDVDPSLWGAKKHPAAKNLTPNKDRFQIKAIKKFASAKKPILGICRGEQLINVAFGGSMIQNLFQNKSTPTYEKGFHKVKNIKGSWIYKVYGPSPKVYFYHHQAVDKLGSGIVITSWSVDHKYKHVEAIEHKTLPIYGVQWHPDAKVEKQGNKIFVAFKKVCLDNMK